MKEYNCIIVFDTKKENILFCKRKKEPYKNLYNFVGGKRENSESSEEAAYRELFEETGIHKHDIQLHYFMNIKYDFLGYELKMFYGMINRDYPLHEEINPLTWLPTEQDYYDAEVFAGDQNIGHIIRMALKCISSE